MVAHDDPLFQYQTSCFRRTSHGSIPGSAVSAKGSIHALQCALGILDKHEAVYVLPDVNGDRCVNFFSATVLGVSASGSHQLDINDRTPIHVPLNWKYSYSTPATGSHPELSAAFMTLYSVPRGQTGIGS